MVRRKPPPRVALRALGDASITTPVTKIEPGAEVLFAAALYLLLERDAPVSRQKLQSLLWPSISPKLASHRLRQTLLKLRQLGLPIELKGRGNLVLGSASLSVDYEEFLASRKGVDRNSNDALVMLPGYEPRFSQPFLEWLDARKQEVNASMTRVMLGIIARHRVKGEWVEAELNASRLLRFQPYNEEATLAMAEACAMRGGKLQAMQILDRYLSEVGRGPTDLRLPATIMRRRIADRMHPRAEAVMGESPLVGRGPMMEQLGELLDRSRHGKGQACLVWGDAGVGKTRLLSEFSTFASLQGIPTQRVQCRPSDPHRPLSVFVDLVPGLRSMRGAIGCAPETFNYLDKLTKHRPTKVEMTATDSDAEFVYARVQQALFDLMDAVSEEGCFIVVIEDVHWIDATSAQVLRDMIAWASVHSVLFAFTGRDQPGGWLSTETDGLAVMHLPPLETGPSEDVVLGVVRQQGREIDKSYLDWCVKVAEGNPYFLQELANHWIETGEEHTVPSSLAAVLNKRIGRLTADALQILQTCGLLETNSTLQRIEKVMGFEPHRLLRSMNELGSAGMILIDAGDAATKTQDRILSRHDLLSNAALAHLSAPARAFLHQRVGAVLEEEIDQEQSTSLLWDCAKHWQLGGDVDRAFQLAKSCATHLLDVGLPGAAADAYEKSLAFCTTAEETLEILEGQAHAYYRSNNWNQVSGVIRKARKVVFSIDPKRNCHDELELMALRAEWRALRLEPGLKRALACVNDERASANHRVQAGAMALMLLDQTCQLDGMPSVFETIQDLSCRAGVTRSARLQTATVYHTACGDLDIAVESAQELVETERKTGNIGEVLRALCNAAVPLRTIGLFDEAEHMLLEALTLAEHRKIERSRLQVLTLLTNMALECGRNEQAHKWWALMLSHASLQSDKFTHLEVAGIATRLALLSDTPSDAKRSMVSKLSRLQREPLSFGHAYQSALYVAADLAAGNIPKSGSLEVLERAHLHSRRNVFQAFAAYTLFLGLKVAGNEKHGTILLDEYLSDYRREPTPAPTHLLHGLERAVALAGQSRHR
jgi:DNA-binding SARP family transcriptional activator/tetratricopeptide (TPR) repeat protein